MSDDKTAPFNDTIDLPPESKFSYVLNGLSNGMLLSSAAIVISNVMRGRQITDLSSSLAKFASVSGAFVGAVYGLHEANRVHEYRAAVSHELKKLRHEVNTHRTWHHKTAEHPHTPETATTR